MTTLPAFKLWIGSACRLTLLLAMVILPACGEQSTTSQRHVQTEGTSAAAPAADVSPPPSREASPPPEPFPLPSSLADAHQTFVLALRPDRLPAELRRQVRQALEADPPQSFSPAIITELEGLFLQVREGDLATLRGVARFRTGLAAYDLAQVLRPALAEARGNLAALPADLRAFVEHLELDIRDTALLVSFGPLEERERADLLRRAATLSEALTLALDAAVLPASLRQELAMEQQVSEGGDGSEGESDRGPTGPMLPRRLFARLAAAGGQLELALEDAEAAKQLAEAIRQWQVRTAAQRPASDPLRRLAETARVEAQAEVVRVAVTGDWAAAAAPAAALAHAAAERARRRADVRQRLGHLATAARAWAADHEGFVPLAGSAADGLSASHGAMAQLLLRGYLAPVAFVHPAVRPVPPPPPAVERLQLTAWLARHSGFLYLPPHSGPAGHVGHPDFARRILFIERPGLTSDDVLAAAFGDGTVRDLPREQALQRVREQTGWTLEGLERHREEEEK